MEDISTQKDLKHITGESHVHPQDLATDTTSDGTQIVLGGVLHHPRYGKIIFINSEQIESAEFTTRVRVTCRLSILAGNTLVADTVVIEGIC